VHATAVVDPSARLGAGVHVGPNAVIERDAVIGDGAVVEASCYVGAGSEVGAGTRLYPRVTLYDGVRVGRDCILHSGVVLGADGFGFARVGGRHRKIPQVGGVVVGDDVEIGANSCIDRGTMEPTRIGTNTKIDNLVQVGHNCVVGERVILCGQVGIAGTTVIESDAVLGGQAGVAGHLTIGRGAMAAAQAGIISSVEAGAKVGGHPHMPLPEWLRMQAAMRQLVEMRAELKRLTERVAALDGGSDGAA
jgi:UDP-3-O-[3-hydroxymyristoyl] glucosamine N-acyltransferase